LIASSARIEQWILTGGKRQFFGDLRVLDLQRLIDGLAFHPLGDERGRGNRRSATVGLELGILDDAILADLDLQFHHIATGRRANHAGRRRPSSSLPKEPTLRGFS
jgi:hypothetical protein